jgi:thiamine-phosphate pyrophosphorylase
MPRQAVRSKALSAPPVDYLVAVSTINLCERLRVYVVIDPGHCRFDPVETCRMVLDGGATALQLRSKRSTDRETLRLAESIRVLSAASGTLFFVNDRLDIALACGADGLHLGVDDLPLEQARRIGGDQLIIGFSPEYDEQAKCASSQGADYLGIGPIFGTISKDDAGPAIGIETLVRRKNLSGLPVIGIGGINPANAALVVGAGACGVAAMSAIIGAESPQQVTAGIAGHVESGSQRSM